MTAYIQYLMLLSMMLCCFSKANAQPGDRPFTVAIIENSVYVECPADNYQLYACSVEYPNTLRRDSLELTWKPDLKTLKIIDTLQCYPNIIVSDGLPYKSVYQARSCLFTDILMVIRNRKDTMLICKGGSDPYLWKLSPNRTDLGLPSLFYFHRGLFYLGNLKSEDSYTYLFNIVHRDYFLLNNIDNPVLIADKNRITLLKLAKQHFLLSDMVSISVTGRILDNGACAGLRIFWTLQKFEKEQWIIVKDYCCEQMDCGLGVTVVENATIPLFILKEKVNNQIYTFPDQMNLTKGKYRLIIYDDNFQIYKTNAFTVG